MSRRVQDFAIQSGFAYLKPYLRKLLAQHPHVDRNVFVMMPFSTSTSESIFDAIAKELQDHGLIALRADKKALFPVLWWNVVTYMLGSSYGVVVYEPCSNIPFNPNVSIEAGFMLALDRPVLFLANDELQRLPVDFSGHISRRITQTKAFWSPRRAWQYGIGLSTTCRTTITATRSWWCS